MSRTGAPIFVVQYITHYLVTIYLVFWWDFGNLIPGRNQRLAGEEVIADNQAGQTSLRLFAGNISGLIAEAG